MTRMKRMVARISEGTGRNLSRESTRRLVARKTRSAVIAMALSALSIPAFATECSDYREKITAFGVLISDFEKTRRFDAPAYETATATLNVSQHAAIKARREPTAPADLEVATAAKASLDASLVVTKNALTSAKASVDVIGKVLIAMPGATIGNPSALASISEVSDAASAASSLAAETGQSAAIAAAFAWLVFHKAIYAAVCR